MAHTPAASTTRVTNPPGLLSQGVFVCLIFKDFIYLFSERREGGRETSVCERNINRLPLAHPQLGTWPTTQACALTGNRTGELLVRRPAPNLLSHTSQGTVLILAPPSPASWEPLSPGQTATVCHPNPGTKFIVLKRSKRMNAMDEGKSNKTATVLGRRQNGLCPHFLDEELRHRQFKPSGCSCLPPAFSAAPSLL